MECTYAWKNEQNKVEEMSVEGNMLVKDWYNFAILCPENGEILLKAEIDGEDVRNKNLVNDMDFEEYVRLVEKLVKAEG